MSQAGILNNAIIPAGSAIDTITGNTGGAVGPDGANNIFLIGANGITVNTDFAPPNTLIIDAQGTKYTLETNDATETPFPPFAFEFTVLPNTAVTVTATIVGTRDDFSASAWGTVVFGARRAGGAAVAVQVATPNQGNDGGAGVTIGARVVGNAIQVTVTGEAATDWLWTATIQTLVQN